LTSSDLRPLTFPPRVRLALAASGLLILALALPLFRLVRYVANHDLHSYVLLVPFISGYLLWTRRKELPRVFVPAHGAAVTMAILGYAALGWAYLVSKPTQDGDSFHTYIAFAFVSLWIGIGFATMGRRWMAAAAFPVAFLYFMVPLPDSLVDTLETASKLASTEVASFFFQVAGVPNVRDGTFFKLPGIVIQVAQECSGIRSSLILIITSLIASHMFLRTTWRRVVLVAFVIPLGIIRNGFRILVIGWLCVNVGPQMIDHAIHHRGGPIFFALSLIPLFLLLWWLLGHFGWAR